jgi:endonuclease/exonuclease/phosphatase family metal-dependent hydrolase
VDGGASSRDSYKEFHSRESSDTSRRPRLIVNYGSSTSSGSTSSSSTTSSASAARPDANGDVTMGPSHLTARAGRWVVESDSSAIGSQVVRHPDAGAGKISTASSSPANYFEMTFEARAGTAYRLWIHGKAQNNYWGNDSVFVQFSGSVTSSGSATYRIGTTSATEVNIEECNGCGLSGWQWQDNGWGTGVLGPRIYFATTGVHTIRVQTREDGLSIDRIVLSPSTYMSSAPGSSSSGGSSSGDTSGDTGGSTSGSTTTLKVLHWNIHHGVGTDGVYDIDTIASWIARTGANVVSLNEVEKYTGWGNEDQPARFASLLRSRTGRTWYYNFAQRDGNTNGQGNLILSTFQLESSSDYELSYSRSVARVAVIVNGIRVNVYSTHLDADSSSRRSTQMRELLSWADNYPEQRIIAGDFNAWPGATEISIMKADYKDSWAVAQSLDIDVAYSGNTAGNTRNSRIDYIWHSENASRLKLKQVRVYDVRNSSGVMPSDHRPLMATYEVK